MTQQSEHSDAQRNSVPAKANKGVGLDEAEEPFHNTKGDHCRHRGSCKPDPNDNAHLGGSKAQLGEIDPEEHTDEAGRQRANECARVENLAITHALLLSAAPGVFAREYSFVHSRADQGAGR